MSTTLVPFTSSSFSAPVTSATSTLSDSLSTDANAIPSNFLPNQTLLALRPILRSHPASPSILGLQDAFHPSGGASNIPSSVGITVFRDGCWLPNDITSANCSQACTKPDLIFSNTSTLHNCVVYPTIARYLLAVGQSETVDSSVEHLVQNLMNLGYRTDTLDPGPAIDQCFKDYCNGPVSGCKNYLSPVPQNSSLRISKPCGEGQLQNISCFFDICGHINSAADPDIGGQGVRSFKFLVLLAPIFCTGGSQVLKVCEHRRN